jgi:hypothetical protein
VNLYLAVEHDIENWNNSKSASETNPGIIAMAIKDLFRIVADETSQVGSPSISSQIHVEMSCVELSGTQQCRNLLKGQLKLKLFTYIWVLWL